MLALALRNKRKEQRGMALELDTLLGKLKILELVSERHGCCDR
jgi:hypothetical protein